MRNKTAEIILKKREEIREWIILTISTDTHQLILPEQVLLDIINEIREHFLLNTESSSKTAYQKFKEVLFDCFLWGVFDYNQNVTNISQAEYLNRFNNIFFDLPEDFANAYKDSLGILLTQQNCPLKNIIYEEHRNLFILYLGVQIEWASGINGEIIEGYDSSFRQFLYDNILVFKDSGYCQVALNYFSLYRSEYDFFDFLKLNYSFFKDEDDYARLIDAFDMLYHNRGNSTFLHINIWLYEESKKPKYFVKMIEEWLVDIRADNGNDVYSELLLLHIKKQTKKIPLITSKVQLDIERGNILLKKAYEKNIQLYLSVSGDLDTIEDNFQNQFGWGFFFIRTCYDLSRKIGYKTVDDPELYSASEIRDVAEEYWSMVA